MERKSIMYFGPWWYRFHYDFFSDFLKFLNIRQAHIVWAGPEAAVVVYPPCDVCVYVQLKEI